MLLTTAVIYFLLGLHRFSDRPEPMDTWIDSEIQGHEREVMREVLKTLPVGGYENVTYLDKDRKIYSNRVNGRGVIARPVGNGLYTYDSKEFFPLSSSH
jgi:hypothetical protein